MQLVAKGRTETERVDIVYLGFLSRLPTKAERDLIGREHVVPSQLAWMLMNSREFMFIQ
jgi:hypothetical protein